jgi:sodium/bile acid cotransporter 7
MRKLKLDPFIAALLASIAFAYFIPQIDQYLPLHEISRFGIAGIFFFYGLKLNLSQLFHDLRNWKLHLLIQFTTFFIFPLCIIALLPFLPDDRYRMLWLALFFLAALPSTVSSSVVMVSIAKGNIPAAIFNASISGLIGIFITPLWMSVFIGTYGGSFDASHIVVQLALQVLLPVFLGVILNRYWGKWASKNKSRLSLFDKSIILLIVYNSFSDSFNKGIFESINVLALISVAIIAILLFYGVYGISNYLSKSMQFNTADRITALFCGSKKSLVHGSVFAGVLFHDLPQAGLMLVPIMIYHAFQLIVVSIKAQKFGLRNK